MEIWLVRQTFCCFQLLSQHANSVTLAEVVQSRCTISSDEGAMYLTGLEGCIDVTPVKQLQVCRKQLVPRREGVLFHIISARGKKYRARSQSPRFLHATLLWCLASTTCRYIELEETDLSRTSWWAPVSHTTVLAFHYRRLHIPVRGNTVRGTSELQHDEKRSKYC
jgi:hypothetical protein